MAFTQKAPVWIPIDAAFRQVKDLVGFADLAIHEINAALAAGRLRAMVKWLRGDVLTERNLPVIFWKEGRGRVVWGSIPIGTDERGFPIYGSGRATIASVEFKRESGQHFVFVRRDDLLRYWPPADPRSDARSNAVASKQSQSVRVMEVWSRLSAQGVTLDKLRPAEVVRLFEEEFKKSPIPGRKNPSGKHTLRVLRATGVI